MVRRRIKTAKVIGDEGVAQIPAGQVGEFWTHALDGMAGGTDFLGVLPADAWQNI